MQSMLNRITINCINLKNSRDSKYSPSAHNRRMHLGRQPRQLEHPPFPTRRHSIHKIYRFYEGSSGKVATYRMVIFYFLLGKLRHLRRRLSVNMYAIDGKYYCGRIFWGTNKCIGYVDSFLS